MKRILLALLGMIAAYSICCAQESDEMVVQPTRVVGRGFNDDGGIIKELVSEFFYLENGKLFRYDFPDYYLNASFSYSGDYLTEESVIHDGFEHSVFERAVFTYEDGHLKTKSHFENSYYQEWTYSYFDDGRLGRIDYSEDHGDCLEYWLYDYEDNGHTVIETRYSKWGSLGWMLGEKATSHYDNSFNLSSKLVEEYNESGELRSAKKTNYSYTEGCLLAEWVDQTLDNGTWTNTATHRYVRDAEGTIVERLDGTWDSETNEWSDSKKITFETSEDGKTYTVTFYKNSGSTWVWDVFQRQTVLFGEFLKPQQRMLSYMYYEDAFGHGNINQIEFTLEQTKEPVYLDASESAVLETRLYPNPGTDIIQVATPAKNAVVRFYDMQGRLVLAQPFDFNTTIHAESWAQGIYVWEIWDGFNKAASGKWIKK